jgi:hypothetical protein
MLDEYVRQYRGMTPEQAETDLKATLQADPLLRSLVSQAKQQAYITAYPNRPLQLQVPAPPQPGAGQEPKPTTPPQGRTGPPVPPKTSSAQPQDIIKRYVAYYKNLPTPDLLREQHSLMLSDPLAMNVLTSYRLSAINMLLQQRQGTLPPGPMPPALTPQED